MGKFKVGDRVRVLGENNPVGQFKGLKVGTETTIKKESSVNGGWILDGSNEMYFYTEDQFELIEEPWDYDPRTATNDNSLKIEAGKYYKTRDGRKVGPMESDGSNHMQWTSPDGFWRYDNGRIFSQSEDCEDLIAEWVDEPTVDAPLTASITADCSALNAELDAILAKLKRIKKKARKLGIDISSGDLRAA